MSTPITITTSALEYARAIVFRAIQANQHSVTYRNRTYWFVPHQSPDGLRYNLQIDDRWYTELTISSLAATIAYDQ